MKKHRLYGTMFEGNEASDYAKKNGRLDFRTLAKAFDAVMNNGIISHTDGVIGYWEQIGGYIDNSEAIYDLTEKANEIRDDLSDMLDDDKENTAEYMTLQQELEDIEYEIGELEDEQNYQSEIFQFYIISDYGAGILETWTDEIVFYNEELDMYVWGVTHYGTSWDYVLTEIELNCDSALDEEDDDTANNTPSTKTE